MTKDEFEVKSSAEKQISFNRWMNEPMVRAMLSMLPPSEHLEVVLRSSFESGFSSGSVNAIISVLEHTVSKK
jgi:hypothetical protein